MLSKFRIQYPLEVVVFVIPLLYFIILCILSANITPLHYILGIGVPLLSFFHISSKKVILAFFLFIVWLLVYDSIRFWPTQIPHIQDLYELEKSIFSITSPSGELWTFNEYFKNNTIIFLDIFCGIIYLQWVLVPMGFAIFLYFKDKKLFIQYSYIFVFTNFLGYFIFFLYPAAPPWYVELYGFEYKANVFANEAGLKNFDDFFGIQLFKNIYSQNPQVFGAVPSLHSAYPLVVAMFAWKHYKKISISIFLFALSTWFSGVYLRHHYLLDILAGISVAICIFYLFKKVIFHLNFFKKHLNQFSLMISLKK